MNIAVRGLGIIGSAWAKNLIDDGNTGRGVGQTLCESEKLRSNGYLNVRNFVPFAGFSRFL